MILGPGSERRNQASRFTLHARSKMSDTEARRRTREGDSPWIRRFRKVDNFGGSCTMIWPGTVKLVRSASGKATHAYSRPKLVEDRRW
jgi:hypothetical protein